MHSLLRQLRGFPVLGKQHHLMPSATRLVEHFDAPAPGCFLAVVDFSQPLLAALSESDLRPVLGFKGGVLRTPSISRSRWGGILNELTIMAAYAFLRRLGGLRSTTKRMLTTRATRATRTIRDWSL